MKINNNPKGENRVIGRRELLTFTRITLMSFPLLGLATFMSKSSTTPAAFNSEKTASESQDKKLRIGVIGAGWLGGTVGSLLVKAGHEVMFSSRHPEELKSMAAKLGERASVGTTSEAAAFGNVLLFAVPYDAIPQLGIDLKDLIKGKIVLDACNGGSDALGEEVKVNGNGPTTAKYLSGARVVRVFSSEDATSIGSSFERTTKKLAIPIASNDKEGLNVALI